jgi:O-antigen/teichoic acid export membrane protein
MSLSRVVRGSLWLYIGGIGSSALGYIYWLLASQFVAASTVGSAAAVVAIVTLITSVTSLGIPSGTMRLLGKAHGYKERDALNLYFSSSMGATIFIFAIASVLTVVLCSLLGIQGSDILFIAVLVSLYQSILQTHIIAAANLVSAVFRLALGVAYLYLGLNFVGVLLAFVTSALIQNFVLLISMRGRVTIVRPSAKKAGEVIRAGIPDWVPSLVSTWGTWLGVLGVYGFSGSSTTGTYYIAFLMASLVFTLPNSILTLMFPLLSGMEDGRKRATNRSVKLAFTISAPIAAVGIAYPYVPLSILGASYVPASFTLQLLLLGVFMTPITSGFYSLVYAYGKYRYVTLLGLALNLPRVILYTPLVSLWGESGAAVAYTSGFLFALLAVLVLSRRISYSVGWKSSLLFCLLPILIAAIVAFAKINWILGTVVILFVSILAFTRLGMVTREDIKELVNSILSKRQIDAFYPYSRYLLQVLYGE